MDNNFKIINAKNTVYDCCENVLLGLCGFIAGAIRVNKNAHSNTIPCIYKLLSNSVFKVKMETVPDAAR